MSCLRRLRRRFRLGRRRIALGLELVLLLVVGVVVEGEGGSVGDLGRCYCGDYTRYDDRNGLLILRHARLPERSAQQIYSIILFNTRTTLLDLMYF
jgi:hypothetical protein